MSHWLYIHKDMAGTPNVWKPGITALPYSAVRARQKFTWTQFSLDYLFFGRPRDIKFLENKIKFNYKHQSGNNLNPYGAQTEIFKVDIQDLLLFINGTITQYNLDVRRVELEKPYTATSSSQCPFKCPQEYNGWRWCNEKETALFGEEQPSYFQRQFLVEE
jgi:hypothetical protein